MGAELTRLQQGLRDRLQALYVDKGLWEGFAKAWAGECGTAVLSDPEALLADSLQQDPLDLLEAVARVAPSLGKPAAGAGATAEVLRQVAIAICLVGCEARVSRKCKDEGIAALVPGDNLLIGVTEQLAAAVIAAVWCENGVKLRFDEQTRKAEALNVMHHVPPLEFGFQGPRECVKAELQATVKLPTDALASFDRRGLLQEVKILGVVSDDVLEKQLQRYDRKHEARLMFGLNSRAHHPMDDPALRKEFATRFGVPTFRYGDAATDDQQEADREAWKRANLQADVMSYLLTVCDLLSPPQAQARSVLHDMHFQAALSFAGEHRSYVREVALALIEKLGGDAVFYDDNFKAQLARPDADLLLQNVYRRQSDLVVVFLGGKYQEKDWCAVEMRVVRELIKNRQGERIMFFRFDDEEVDGVLSTDITIHCRTHTSAEAARLILDRLAVTDPKP